MIKSRHNWWSIDTEVVQSRIHQKNIDRALSMKFHCPFQTRWNFIEISWIFINEISLKFHPMKFHFHTNRPLKIFASEVISIYRPNFELRRACCNCFNMAFFNDYNPQYSYHRYPKQSYLLFLDEYTKKILLRFVP